LRLGCKKEVLTPTAENLDESPAQTLSFSKKNKGRQDAEYARPFIGPNMRDFYARKILWLTFFSGDGG
jgi:hypothetical protein